jgi:signal transduction histidine kinase
VGGGALRREGASAAILILTVILTWRTLREPAVFADLPAERGVLALQLFLIALSVPMLLLGAVIDDLRGAERRSRGLAARLLTAQDEERRRIARDLHDSTGQNLVAATLLTGQVQALLPPSAAPIMRKLEDMLQLSIREIRTVSYLLHPPFLDEEGVALALREYTDGFAARSNIKVDLHIAADLGRLPGDVELVLFRVVQEALANVARHSESKTARIDLARMGAVGRRHVALTIEDRGKGMPVINPRRPIRFANKAGTSRGVGLASMRERVEQVGGRIEIDSAVGRTVVRTYIPVRH